MRYGGARGARTPDLLHAMQALSQLSYGPGWYGINAIRLVYLWNGARQIKRKTPRDLLAVVVIRGDVGNLFQ